MKSMSPEIIIIDDDPINNIICTQQIKRKAPDIKIVDFISPLHGLSYITDEHSQRSSASKTILLLDINMPVMTGWEFLDRFDTLCIDIKNNFMIYILSSSFDPIDKNGAKTNPLVKDFISKPLTEGVIITLLKELRK
ncbi:MAG TPA: response regulator [Bacteroidia bacterium]|jgi:CheY-like chemotaxis protein|nr:response regulator [Bacteroidia bacterium]